MTEQYLDLASRPAATLGHQPVLEVGCVTDAEPLAEQSASERGCAGPVAGAGQPGELVHVQLHRAGLKPDLIRARTELIAEHGAENTDRFVEGVPGPCLRLIGPEQGDQMLPAAGSPR